MPQPALSKPRRNRRTAASKGLTETPVAGTPGRRRPTLRRFGRAWEPPCPPRHRAPASEELAETQRSRDAGAAPLRKSLGTTYSQRPGPPRYRAPASEELMETTRSRGSGAAPLPEALGTTP